MKTKYTKTYKCDICEKRIHNNNPMIYLELGRFDPKAKLQTCFNNLEYKPFFNEPDSTLAVHLKCFKNISKKFKIENYYK